MSFVFSFFLFFVSFLFLRTSKGVSLGAMMSIPHSYYNSIYLVPFSSIYQLNKFYDTRFVNICD